MKKYSQGNYKPQNPNKILGNPDNITYRSSWELKCMHFLDTHPNVIQWGSECLKIPYINPFTGKSTIYIPDFVVRYRDVNGIDKAEVIEVKPAKETFMEMARTQRDRAYQALNLAKWRAAFIFCNKHGLKFRVITESDIFRSNPTPKKPKTSKRNKKT